MSLTTCSPHLCMASKTPQTTGAERLPNLNYSNIMILASAVFGNFIDQIKLNFSDGKMEDVVINISEWWSDKPVYDEQIAWNGPVYKKKEGIFGYTFANIYSLNRLINRKGMIESITLPDCPYIHIFAITLLEC